MRDVQKSEKVIYWAATGFVLFALGWSFVTYHVMYDFQVTWFERFGYPTYLVYPLAYLKLIAIIVIVTNRYNNLKEMAYGAYFINMVIAAVGHLVDGHHPWHAYIGLVCVPISYIYSNRVRGRSRGGVNGVPIGPIRLRVSPGRRLLRARVPVPTAL